VRRMRAISSVHPLMKFEPTHVGCYELDLKVRSCRLASRITSTQKWTPKFGPVGKLDFSGMAWRERATTP
jgi:hypothetical protein